MTFSIWHRHIHLLNIEQSVPTIIHFKRTYIRITYLTYSLNRPQKLKVDSVELWFWYGLDLRLLLIIFHRYAPYIVKKVDIKIWWKSLLLIFSGTFIWYNPNNEMDWIFKYIANIDFGRHAVDSHVIAIYPKRIYTKNRANKYDSKNQRSILLQIQVPNISHSPNANQARALFSGLFGASNSKICDY